MTEPTEYEALGAYIEELDETQEEAASSPSSKSVRVIGRIGPDLRPLVPIVVQGANGQERNIPVLLSTGFQEALLLPAADVAALGLPQIGTQAVTFPDGSQIDATVHPAKILLAGEAVDVDILAGGREPRMGLALLQNCRLSMRFTAGAAIIIERTMTPD